MTDESLDVKGDERTFARRIVTVTGGKGGVGKSTLAVSLAVYFAQLGKTVLLVDADLSGGNLHAQLGVSAAREEPPLKDSDTRSFRDFLVTTTVPGLMLLPAPHESPEPPTSFRASRKGKWLARIREQPFDLIVLAGGPGHGKFQLDLAQASDLAILLATPDPPAIEATYRFIRALHLRRLERALLQDRFRLPLFHRAVRELGVLPSPLELVRKLEKFDKPLGELAWGEVQRGHLGLVINRVRLRSDAELVSSMAVLSLKHYGVMLEELGFVEEEEAVLLSLRRGSPLLVESPASKAGRNFERISRRVLALLTARTERLTTTIPPERPNLYEGLGVAPSATEEEIRRAFKRRKDIYAEASIGAHSIVSPEGRKSELARLDEAHDTLLDPVRRRAYDLSTFPDDPPPERGARVSQRPPAAVLEQRLLEAELLREIGPDTEFRGEILRKVRESAGIEIEELSRITKISKAYLNAIEDERYEALPAEVYVRGFLVEFARTLGLEPSQVWKTYLLRLKRRTGQVER